MKRRDVLRGAGLAGAVALSGLAGGRSASAREQVRPLEEVLQQPDILADEVFPIGFFWPPPLAETTNVRYAEIAEAGFTVVTSGNDVYSMPANDRLLNAAADNGLRALPLDERISNIDRYPCDQWPSLIDQTLREYRQYPAFSGFRIADEPSPTLYPRIRTTTDVLTELDPAGLSHVNLVPIYDLSREAVYREFLSRYIAQVSPAMVSFDHYPLLTDGSTRSSYFLNWELVRRAALEAGLPTWVYILAVDHWNLRRPNKAELFWQVNMSLAYGCKGIQYFTYWTPANRPDFEFGQALISKTGTRTQVYEDAKEINTTYLQPVGRQLKHKVSESVVHTYQPLPAGTAGFGESDQLRAVSGAAVLGQFTAPDGGGRRWLLVANPSYESGATVDLTVQPAVGSVSEFNPSTGRYEPVELNPTRGFSSALQPGTARLYQLTPQPA